MIGAAPLSSGRRAGGRRRRDRAPGRRRRAHRSADARARVGDRDRRGEALGARARRRRRSEAAAPLRPRRRPPLRPRLGVHQVDARQRPRRSRLLPRRDARGRRGPALPRPPDRDRRERGRRQRRSARLAGRGRGRPGSRARRAPGGAAEPGAGRDLRRAGAEVERVGPRDLGRARPTCAARGSPSRRRCSVAPATAAPRCAVTESGTSRRTTIPPRERSTTSRRACEDGRTMFRPGTARRRRRRVAIGTGDRAPEFDLEEARGQAACAARRLPRPLERAPRLPPVRVHGGLRRGGAGPPGEPRVVPQREHRDRVRLVRRVLPRARPGSASSAPSTRSRPTSGRTARRRSATACSTRRPAPPSAARS